MVLILKKLKFLLNDIRLTFHWHYIHKYRREAAVLINKGTGCFHPDLVKYSNKILSHGMVVSKIWNSQKQYAPRHLDIDDERQKGAPAITA